MTENSPHNYQAVLLHELGHVVEAEFFNGDESNERIQKFQELHNKLAGNIFGFEHVDSAENRRKHQESRFGEFIAETFLNYVAQGPQLREHIQNLRNAGKTQEADAYQEVYDFFKNEVFKGREFLPEPESTTPRLKQRLLTPLIVTVALTCSMGVGCSVLQQLDSETHARTRQQALQNVYSSDAETSEEAIVDFVDNFGTPSDIDFLIDELQTTSIATIENERISHILGELYNTAGEEQRQKIAKAINYASILVKARFVESIDDDIFYQTLDAIGVKDVTAMIALAREGYTIYEKIKQNAVLMLEAPVQTRNEQSLRLLEYFDYTFEDIRTRLPAEQQEFISHAEERLGPIEQMFRYSEEYREFLTTHMDVIEQNVRMLRNADPNYGFNDKDTYLLANIDPTRIASRNNVIERINQKLNTLEHVSREDFNGIYYTENFHETIEQLTMADLLMIELVMDSLTNPELAQTIGIGILKDLGDPESEHGGILTMQGLETFNPRCQGDNCVYRMTPELRNSILAEKLLTHVHFHATQLDGASGAGPSSGQTRFDGGDRMQMFVDNIAGIIITPVISEGQGKYNVDVYFPNGAVVDLGVYYFDYNTARSSLSSQEIAELKIHERILELESLTEEKIQSLAERTGYQPDIIRQSIQYIVRSTRRLGQNEFEVDVPEQEDVQGLRPFNFQVETVLREALIEMGVENPQVRCFITGPAHCTVNAGQLSEEQIRDGAIELLARNAAA